jgi:hypothetical protein
LIDYYSLQAITMLVNLLMVSSMGKEHITMPMVMCIVANMKLALGMARASTSMPNPMPMMLRNGSMKAVTCMINAVALVSIALPTTSLQATSFDA